MKNLLLRNWIEFWLVWIGKWEMKSLLVFSDHVPLFLDTGSKTTHGGCFRFELSWFLREDLYSKVQRIWNLPTDERSSLDSWDCK